MSTFTDEVLDDLGRYRETEEAVQTAADLRCWARAWGKSFVDTIFSHPPESTLLSLWEQAKKESGTC